MGWVWLGQMSALSRQWASQYPHTKFKLQQSRPSGCKLFVVVVVFDKNGHYSEIHKKVLQMSKYGRRFWDFLRNWFTRNAQ